MIVAPALPISKGTSVTQLPTTPKNVTCSKQYGDFVTLTFKPNKGVLREINSEFREQLDSIKLVHPYEPHNMKFMFHEPTRQTDPLSQRWTYAWKYTDQPVKGKAA